jgi:hypothetical protein
MAPFSDEFASLQQRRAANPRKADAPSEPIASVIRLWALRQAGKAATTTARPLSVTVTTRERAFSSAG